MVRTYTIHTVRISAFETIRESQILSIQPVIECAAGGITTTVLIYESPRSCHSSGLNVRPYAKQASVKIENILSLSTDLEKFKSLKYRKNKKVDGVLLAFNPAPIVHIFKIITCYNFVELNYYLNGIAYEKNLLDDSG